MPLGTAVYIAAAVPLSRWLGTQGLAIATTVAAVTVFIALLVALARKVPKIRLLRTTGGLALYAVLGGTAMLGATAALTPIEWSPLAVAIATLSLGSAAYAAALYFGNDRTFRALLGLVGAYLGRGSEVSADHRSSKAPPARKSD